METVSGAHYEAGLPQKIKIGVVLALPIATFIFQIVMEDHPKTLEND